MMIAATGAAFAPLGPRTRNGVIEGLFTVVKLRSPSWVTVTASGAVLPSDPGAPFAHNGTEGRCAPAPVTHPTHSATTLNHRTTPTFVTRIATPRSPATIPRPPNPPQWTTHLAP